MRLPKTRKSPHWDDDEVYVAWAPWRLRRWWTSLRLFFLLGGAIALITFSFLLGAPGGFFLLVFFVATLVFGATKNRRRGIGLTKRNELVFFGPHYPVPIQVKEIMSFGVMRVNRLASLNFSRDPKDDEIHNSRIRRLFSIMGYSGRASARSKEAAKSRETLLNSGRGLIVVIRDSSGEFWPVSPASGYEVAALRDMAQLVKLPFISPDKPLNMLRENKSRKMHQSKVKVEDSVTSEELRVLGVDKVGSLSRRNAFIRANCSPDGEVGGISKADASDISLGKRKVAITAGSWVVSAFFLLFVAPFIFMMYSPVNTGGVLTASWPRPYERIWDPVPGWTLTTSGELNFSVELTPEDGSDARVLAELLPNPTSSCAEIVEDTVLSALSRATEDDVPFTPDEVEQGSQGEWVFVSVPSGEGTESFWCRDFSDVLYNDPPARLVAITRGVEDPFPVVNALNSKPNV